MPKVRLIDANALFMKQKSHADLYANSTVHDDMVRRDEALAALAEILNAPTIGPEVRQGEWIDKQAALYALCEDCKRKHEGLCPHEASKCIEYRAIKKLHSIDAELIEKENDNGKSV